MTTTSFDIIGGIDYTWEDAVWSWADSFPSSHTYLFARAPASITSSVGETLTLSDLESKSLGKSVSETIAIEETKRELSSLLSILEEIELSGSYIDYGKLFIRVTESIKIGEKLRKIDKVTKNTNLGIANSLGKLVSLSKFESLVCYEFFGRTVAYDLGVQEGLSVLDSISKAIHLPKNEAITLFDEYVRRANAVFSDITISKDPITQDEFKDMIESGRAPGFSEFRDFIQGDYSYRRAIFRAVATSLDDTDISLDQFKVEVDVPDVFDRGVAEIVNAMTGVEIDFNRVFNIVPEITITLTGGTVIALPDVIAKSETSFTVILTDASDTRVTGTVSWAAHGY